MKELAQIRARLDTVTEYHPAPHRAVVNSAGDRWGVVDSNGCVVTTDPKDAALLYAHAPADIARLLAAVEAVEGFQEQAVGDKDDLYASRHAEGCNDMLNAIRAALAESLGGDQ